MKTNQEYKNAALAALKGNWKPAVLIALVMMLISCIPSFLGMASENAGTLVSLVVSVCVSYPLSVGVYAAFRKLFSGEEVRLVEDSFDIAFKNWTHNVGGMLLMGVYVFLWSLLLLVPGIIKSCSYAMTPFILTEKPELTAEESIKLSMAMMDGHKMEFFLLCLSFIGWMILGIFTLCIGYLWLIPYMNTTIVAFYEDVKAEYESKMSVAA